MIIINVIKSIWAIVVGVIMIPICLLLPKNRKKVVFGAWGGMNFSDNPKYLMLYLLKLNGWDCVWIGNKHLQNQVKACKGAKFARKGSISAFFHCLSAGYCVENIMRGHDIGKFPTCRKIVDINLWHGNTLKSIGIRQKDGHGGVLQCKNYPPLLAYGKMIRDKMLDYVFKVPVFSSVSSRLMLDIITDAMPNIFSCDRTIIKGQPRVDFLIRNASDVEIKTEIKHKLASQLRVPVEKKWYLYLPTWRHDVDVRFSFLDSKLKAQYINILKDKNAIIIEKQHPKVLERMRIEGDACELIYSISVEDSELLDVQELLLVSDRLITDYSSCFFDFESLERPVIHFAYDYEDYSQKDSGLEYDLYEVAGGPVVDTEEALLLNLIKTDDELLALRGSRYREPIECENGKSCEEIVRTFMAGRC